MITGSRGVSEDYNEDSVLVFDRSIIRLFKGIMGQYSNSFISSALRQLNVDSSGSTAFTMCYLFIMSGVDIKSYRGRLQC